MSKALILCLTIMVIIGMAVMGACVPAASPTPPAKPPAATPPPAAPSPVTPPATPPATAPPAAPKPIEPKFTAATYTNDQFGFSVMYPKRWDTEAAVAPSVFIARVGGQVPGIWVSVFNKATFQQESEAAMKAGGQSNIKYIIQNQDFKLADGKTVCKYNVYTTDWNNGAAVLRSYSIDVPKGDKVISLTVIYLDGTEDEALSKEILGTVSLK